jgi:hypothetical protein
MKQTLSVLTTLLLAPLLTPLPESTSSPILPEKFAQIHVLASAPPIRTAAESLRNFLKSRGVDLPVVTAADAHESAVAGTILLGTTADTPLFARWAKAGCLSVTASDSAGDA